VSLEGEMNFAIEGGDESPHSVSEASGVSGANFWRVR